MIASTIQRRKASIVKSTQLSPPSRETNPFATCWTAPGEIPYVEVEGHATREVLQRLETAKGWGAIVGPHGSGKSTMMQALEAKLVEQGQQVVWIHLTNSRLSQAADQLLRSRNSNSQRTVCLLEGFERLGFLSRQKILWQCFSHKVDVIATLHEEASHWPWTLPTIAALKPSQNQIEQIFSKLIERDPTPLVNWQDAVHSLKAAKDNLRELWFELYLLHERRRGLMKNANTTEPTPF